ncbi:MAG: transglycosylase SLT domain-containing protein, partial [Firmicutes bacterium]|nr:transglycosylase SLT domain-containing protein [Candidatus Fiminaster equi]
MSKATKLIVERQKQRKAIREMIWFVCVSLVLIIIGFMPVNHKLEAEQSDTYINQEYVDYINKVCEEKGICPELVIAVVEAESSGQYDVVSSRGCIGLMQMDPRNDYSQGRNLFDWKQNIDAGTDFLVYLFNEYGDLPAVLTSYNAGEYSDAAKDSMCT